MGGLDSSREPDTNFCETEEEVLCILYKKSIL